MHPRNLCATITAIGRECYWAAARLINNLGLPNELIVGPQRQGIALAAQVSDSIEGGEDAVSRRKRRRLQFTLRGLFLAITAYSLCWGITIRWGVPDCMAHVRAKLESNAPNSSQQIYFDPYNRTEDTVGKPCPTVPWHYAGNGFSPAPCIVGLDVAAMEGELAGGGSREYLLWLFGLKIHLPFMSSPQWMS